MVAVPYDDGLWALKLEEWIAYKALHERPEIMEGQNYSFLHV